MDILKTKYYSHLAAYFTSQPLYLDDKDEKKPNVRKLVEQPWQQTKAEMWVEIKESLYYIQCKIIAKNLNKHILQ